ncbi:hypothetical protein QQF64_036248 [Cirrhinus molitorella]|uniref:Uncharacterized protein n=1 Tax=Cirrhinus molitorella TaxID=172907 RepID=A0ABR3NJ35_9TELE
MSPRHRPLIANALRPTFGRCSRKSRLLCVGEAGEAGFGAAGGKQALRLRKGGGSGEGGKGVLGVHGGGGFDCGRGGGRLWAAAGRRGFEAAGRGEAGFGLRAGRGGLWVRAGGEAGFGARREEAGFGGCRQGGGGLGRSRRKRV